MIQVMSKKVLALTVSVLLCGELMMFPISVGAAEPSSIERLAGLTKNETAVKIAQKLNPGIVPAVVLASPYSYSDALVGIPLAKQTEAPILWVGRTPQESKAALQYIEDYCDPKGIIYILGSTGVIPESIEVTLKNLGYKAEQIKRYGGSNRYETAVIIAQSLDKKGKPIYITAGEDYSQAASAAVLAATKESPIVLLPPKGKIPDSVIQYLSAASDEGASFQIIGNTKVIPESTLTELKTRIKGLDSDRITRLSGNNLYDLMAKANEQAWITTEQEKQKETISQIFLTTGKSYADGIAGAVLAARVGAPLVFIDEPIPSPSTSLLKEFNAWNKEKNIPATRVTVLGGSGVISAKTVAEADSLYLLGESMQGKTQVWTFAELDPFSVPTYGIKEKGNKIILSDAQSHALQMIGANQEIVNYAGRSNGRDQYGVPVGGYLDGSLSQAQFNVPKGLAMSPEGILYVADSANGVIRTIDGQGNVKTLVKDLNRPTDLVLGPQGELYATETLKHRILKVDAQGQWSVLAGGDYDLKDGELVGAYADGSGEKAKFNEPQGLAIDHEGNLYVADTGNQRIRKISPEGMVTTLAGSGETLIQGTSYIEGGYQDGKGILARFNFPLGLEVGKDKTVYVADSFNHTIRIISPEGKVSTLAGNGEPGKRDGRDVLAQFNTPTDVLLWEDGSLIIVDQGNALLRQIILAR